MYTFTIFIVCIQGVFIQTALGNIVRGLGPVGPMSTIGFGADFGPGFGYNYGPGIGYGSGFGSVGSEYSATGSGDVSVAGELGVAGSTSVMGQIPVLGSVSFGGIIPASGLVTISGGCAFPCESRGPYY